LPCYKGKTVEHDRELAVDLKEVLATLKYEKMK
jgi:hypothetical protein